MISCPQGYYCNLATNYQPVICPINYYCPIGTEFPNAAPAGTICVGTGNIVCTKCLKGQKKITDPATPPQEICYACSPGSYAIDAAIGCLPCMPGYLCYGPQMPNSSPTAAQIDTAY